MMSWAWVISEVALQVTLLLKQFWALDRPRDAQVHFSDAWKVRLPSTLRSVSLLEPATLEIELAFFRGFKLCRRRVGPDKANS